uniref:Golgi SNAP receptor complex member 1 n=1 Tax=Saccoglossus kowalevskii TaxID=10224 RepID=A0ABM0MD37_SACKO|nr:PREDICTED: Golgi SNAP receptor complex member 1-like [Saccoglossus kowalevskii]
METKNSSESAENLKKEPTPASALKIIQNIKTNSDTMYDEQVYELRKQARQLENELDLKLVSFSKLGTSYSHKDYKNDRYNSDTSPLLSTSSSERMFDTMAMEIEQLLTKLTGINDKMAEYTSNMAMSTPSAALLHTLQRHRDILQDYTHEFNKTKANISAYKEREDLLGSVRREIDTYKSSSGLNRRTDLYLKENEHLRK